MPRATLGRASGKNTGTAGLQGAYVVPLNLQGRRGNASAYRSDMYSDDLDDRMCHMRLTSDTVCMMLYMPARRSGMQMTEDVSACIGS